MPTICETRYGATITQEKFDWQPLGEGAYQCRVLLCPEEGGGYSAHALRLPGVVTEGDSEAEALENIADAFQAAIQSYRESGESIPWQAVDIERPANSMERWILVNV
jgi:predicted RNase H-like HicB family nuclease